MRKRTTKFVILFIILAILLFSFCHLCSKPKSENSDEFIEKLDSLNSQIDSIYIVKDSILESIDTVYIQLNNNNKQYEKDFNRIVNNDANEDYVFFLNYINSNRARLDSIRNNL